MPIHFDNVQHVGNKGISYTKSKCISPTNVVLPVITGVAEVGQTLTCSTGTWTGTPPFAYNYIWYNSDNVQISLSGNTYEIQSSDIGYSIYCVVQAQNLCYPLPVNATSNSTDVIPAPFDYLFDVFATYSVTPRAAYSFRKLNSAYTGACCRIRRSNDNAELDIGFVSNVVDVASIQAFVPIGASGQIVYIYDQSGNGRHRYQGVANRQPDIIDSFGVLVEQNGRYGCHLNNASRMLQQSTTILPPNANYSCFNVYNETNTGDNIVFVGGINQFGFVSQLGSFSSAYGFMSSSLNRVNNNSVTISTRDDSYLNLTDQGGLIAHYSDFNLQTSWGTNFNFGGYDIVGGGYDWLGYYMEEVYCDGSQVSNVSLSTEVYINQSNYYGLPTFSFDVDYQNVLDYATTQGYTLPSTSQQYLQNQLMLDLKSSGVWNKLDTFANFATDGSSNFALIDWKRLSLYTAVNSPTFTSNVGFQGNGTSSYINSNFDTNLGTARQNNASMGIRYTIASTYMAYHAANRSNITSVGGVNNGMYNGAPTTNTPSFWTIPSGCNTNIRDSSGTYVYDNTSLKTTITNYNTVAGTFFHVLRAIAGTVYSTAQVNFAYFAQAFTSTEVLNLHSALNTYYTSL